MRYEELTIEGRNAVLEAFRAGKPIDKLFVLDGCQDGPVLSITREAKKHDTIINYVAKERLDQISETGKHQGVIAFAAAYEYAQVEDILALAEKKGEPPFIFLLDNIEDPEKARGRADCYGGKDVGRGVELYAGGEGDKPGTDDRRAEEKGNLVCVCRHVRRSDVPPKPERTDWDGNRK